MCAAIAGNPPDVSYACANNLLSVVEGSVGHEDYELYYQDASVRRLAEKLFAVDNNAENYAFGAPALMNIIYQSANRGERGTD